MKQPKPEDVIVTYGEEWTVGKEMLRRALICRYCACCRIRFEPDGPNDKNWECKECRNDPGARQAYS